MVGDRKEAGKKRRYFLLALFSVYYVFIGLLLWVLVSENPKELVSQLWQSLWIQCLVFLGFLSGFYLTFSSCLRLSFIFETYLKSKSYRQAGLVALEFIIQMVWIVLPIELINNGFALSKLNPPILIGGIVFTLSLATFRRIRIKPIKETMEFIQAS